MTDSSSCCVQQCLRDTVRIFFKAFLTQMPNNGLREEEIERLEADISEIRDFFSQNLAHDKVESGMEPLDHLHSLIICETADEFEERFGFMLMDGSSKVKPSDIAVVCSKRPDIGKDDAVAIEKECERLYHNWIAEQSASQLSARSEGAEEGGEKNMLAKMYKRIVKAVGAHEA
jgi:hypothetical protein